MRKRDWCWLAPLCAVAAVISITFVAWVWVSYSTFPDRVRPGDAYMIGGVAYIVPYLPHMRYESSQTPRLDRPIPMLSHRLLTDVRFLMRDSFAAFRAAGLEFWATGGTLISALLWAPGLLPYDDDIDVAVQWRDREYTWSPQFATVLAAHGLETFFLRSASLQKASREGAALRVRRKGTKVPTLDMFYVRPRPDGKWSKVDSWDHGELSDNARETWESDWLFPLRNVDMGDFTVPVGREAEKMLDKQYGPEWRSVIKSPDPMLRSHQFAFHITNLFNAWRVGTVIEGADLSALRAPDF